MDICIGSAELFGIKLNENFNTPYFSENIQEFWQRWHISLNRWFINYIYIPLGGSRKSEFTKYINILIIFFISGLWHGASYNFIIWGLLNGIAIIIYNLWKKINIKISKFTSILLTFIFVNLSWIFFKTTSFSKAILMLKNLTDSNNFRFTFGKNGISKLIGGEKELYVAIVGIVLVWIVDVCGGINNVRGKVGERNIVTRWLCYYFIIFSIIIFGIYGDLKASDFIYGAF
jgi:D-alanyl-lipoteichoic acid acyltransferase DltB (MBOAT superfamily)